jgi:adenylate cyclase
MRFFGKRPPSTSAPAQPAGAEALLAVVSVLFADLEGFTRLAEQLPAREVLAILNRHLEVMVASVEAHGGVVDKYIGDAILVFWNLEDPVRGAEQAVRCALAMHEAIGRVQDEALAMGQQPLRIRIGIATGEAIVGDVGPAHRQERTVIGDTVNMAARLETLNKQFHSHTLISGATLEFVRSRVRGRDLGNVPLSGRREPVRCFEVTGWQPEPVDGEGAS